MNPVIAEVTMRSTGAGLDLVFEFHQTGREVHLPMPDRWTLLNAQDQAASDLAQFVTTAAQLHPTPTAAYNALSVLHSHGRQLALDLAESDYAKRDELSAAFREAWPLWERTDLWTDQDAPVPIVQVHTANTVFPLEQLPVFDLTSLPAWESDESIHRAAARFLGFGAVVQRIPTTPIRGDSVLRNDPKLPVQFFRHRRLTSATQEQEYLQSLSPYVDLHGPWPVSEDERTVPKMLAEAMYTGSPVGAGTWPAGPVQVHHFACHCDTTSTSEHDYVLRLGKDRAVTLFQLKKEYDDRITADQDYTRARTVVVLNACASSHINPRSANSIPRWLLASGHRAFVGTETNVPDAVAAAFSNCLYGWLLEGEPLGTAIVRARRELLVNHRSPLGALYVMYGNIDLRVEQARKGVRH